MAWDPWARRLGEGSMSERPAEDEHAQLRAQLTAAVAAAHDAYRNSTRLIRLLTVLGQPGPPEELVEETMAVLSDVFAADVVCLVGAAGSSGQMRVIGACGLAEDHPAFVTGWPACPAGRGVMTSGRAAWQRVEDDSPNVPSCLDAFGVRSAAWIPLHGEEGVTQLLVLYRSSGETFTDGDLELLGSVAYRLGVSIRARERGLALERLAHAGHRLSRHLDRAELLEEAALLFQELTGAAAVAVLEVVDDRVELRAERGLADAELTAWPLPTSRLEGWGTLGQGTHWFGSENIGGGVHGALYVPILDEGRVELLLRLTGHRPGSVHSTVEVAGTFAVHLAAVLANVSLYRALRHSEASLRLITDAISDLIAVVDVEHRFVYVSPSHRRGLAYSPEDLLGHRITDLVHPDDRLPFLSALSAASSTAWGSTGSTTVECRMCSSDGTWTWVESVLRTAAPGEPSVVVSSRVIEERKRLEEELLDRATHDPLTGFANRSLVTARVEEALSGPTPREIGLLFCDLDKFKAVNDRLGHEAGDDLLRQVAHRLGACLRPADLLARFGGDEFVVVLEDVHRLEDIDDVGRRLLAALQEPFPITGEFVRVSASIGGVIAGGTHGPNTAVEMLRDADAAMYAAKERGRGRLELFDEDASMRSLDRWSLRSDLLNALERTQLLLHFQPIVDLRTGRMVATEALLRWKHPTRGMVAPDTFIAFAEETGAIVPIGRWVLRRACEQLAVWRRLPGGEDMGIHVNLSPLQLDDPLFSAWVMDTLDVTGLPPDALWLEVTERGTLPSGIQDGVARLDRAGVHFTLDDFGMSNSNLAYLKQFPLKGLKIDKSFVSGMATGPVDNVIVRAVLAIAEWMDLSVVAEGIETPDQRDSLQCLGCTHGQGYLFSPPVPAETLTSMLLEERPVLDAPRPG